MFHPDAFLPVQHFDMLRRSTTPEKRLLIAILADAINCFQKDPLANPRKGPRRVSKEAERWLMSLDRTWPFSFENICDVLDLDSSRLRSQLRQWREQQRLTDDGSAVEIPTVETLRNDALPLSLEERNEEERRDKDTADDRSACESLSA